VKLGNKEIVMGSTARKKIEVLGLGCALCKETYRVLMARRHQA
jgi:hypothetical protein